MGEFSSALLRQQVLHWLDDHVSPARVQHVLRVEQMAADLAGLHCLDQHKASQAGLMHDLAKCFSPSLLLNTARSQGLLLDPIDEQNPHLLHADVGAIVARTEFDIADPEVLTAIANHTLGRPAMDALSCVVFLADSLEPGRGNSPVLKKLRQTSQENLTRAVWQTCDYTIQQLIASNRLIHPRAVATRNWFLQQSRRVIPA